MKSSRWYPPFEIFMQPNSNLYYSILLCEYPSRSFRMHPATPSLPPWALAPCRLSAVMIEAHVTKLSVARVAPNIETMVCGDPQEGSGRQRHDHLCKSMSDMSVVFGCGIMWHPWHHEARKFLQAGLDKTMYNQYQLSFKTHSSSYIFIYLYIILSLLWNISRYYL